MMDTKNHKLNIKKTADKMSDSCGKSIECIALKGTENR
jgi:hypothetical protein